MRKFLRYIKILLLVILSVVAIYVFTFVVKGYFAPQESVAIPKTTVITCSEKESLNLAKYCTFLIGDVEKHGTGFLIDPKGYLVTNYHVISDSKDGYVNVFYEGDFHSSRIVGFVSEDDLAVLKIDPGFTSCQWSDSQDLELAESVFAIGWPNSPYGESTITKGVFSRYTFLGNENVPMVQTDSPINPGNSGGPLINKCGVIGINTSKTSWIDKNAPSEGIGYAIASNYAKKVVKNLIEKDTGSPQIPPEPTHKEIAANTDGPETYPDTQKYLDPNDPIPYDYEEVLFWENRKIHDQAVLNSWKKTADSENVDSDLLHKLLAKIEKAIDIADKLWDGYTNSLLTYTQVIELKQTYLFVSKRIALLSNELNITGSINAYKNCREAWDNLEEEYEQDFSEQKEECEDLIDFSD